MDGEESTPAGGLVARDHFLEHCGVIAEFATHPQQRAITRTCLVIQCLIVDLGDFCLCRGQSLPTTEESFATIQNGCAAQLFHDLIPMSIFIENHAKKPLPDAPATGFRTSCTA
jgi:hypothetical protein